MTTTGAPVSLGDAASVRRTEIYTRFTRTGSISRRLFAQVVLVPAAGRSMTVQANPRALGVDFRTQSTRPDVPGELLVRPGFRLAEKLDEAWNAGRSQLLFNGNNVGYWGNQFVIESGAVLGKKKGPIFDDRKLAYRTEAKFTFFCWSLSSFQIKEIDLRAFNISADDTGIGVLPAVQHEVPPSGLSGFPLVRDSKTVWHRELEQAWDPRLLYDGGRLVGVDRTGVLAQIRERTAAAAPLARHAITVAGVDGAGNAIIVVAEKSKQRSDGLSVAGAADLMLELGATDAIALGAAGDAQLASTDEGFLVSPLIERHAWPSAYEVERRHRSRELAGMAVAARPVPCLVTIESRYPACGSGGAFRVDRVPVQRQSIDEISELRG